MRALILLEKKIPLLSEDEYYDDEICWKKNEKSAMKARVKDMDLFL